MDQTEWYNRFIGSVGSFLVFDHPSEDVYNVRVNARHLAIGRQFEGLGAHDLAWGDWRLLFAAEQLRALLKQPARLTGCPLRGWQVQLHDRVLDCPKICAFKVMWPSNACTSA
jgi:hypothetical protein